MIEIIKIIGLEEYLQLTNKFYKKLKKNIKLQNVDLNLAYDKTEFLHLMSYIIRKKMKNDDSFIPNLRKQIEAKFFESKEDPKDYNNSLIQNILKIYCFLDEQNEPDYQEDMELEENEIRSPFLAKTNKNKPLDEETYNKIRNKKI